MLQTEYKFKLPRGYVDRDGNLHRDGIMRLANAMDEIAPLQDPRVQRNNAYLSVVLLSRVITQLGSLDDINPGTIERMFSGDVSYLQQLYERINSNGESTVQIECPHFDEAFDVEPERILGESAMGE